MAEIKTYPYLTAEPAHISVAQDWQYSDGGVGAINLEELVRQWDTSTSLEAGIVIKLDFKRILQDCGLGMDAALRLVTGWRSSGTMLRGSGTRIDLNNSNAKQPLKLIVRVDGTEVSHDITLYAALILVSSGKNSHMLSASVPGSVLWNHENHIALNDAGVYFPTEVSDFRTKAWHVPPESAWYLEWDPADLYQTVFGDIQLYLNSAHPTVANALSTDQPLSELLQQVLFFDIARMLILGALDNPEFIADPSQFPEGSIGFTVLNIIHEYFPDDTPAGLSKKRADKGLFEALLQHHLAFLKSQ